MQQVDMSAVTPSSPAPRLHFKINFPHETPIRNAVDDILKDMNVVKFGKAAVEYESERKKI